jgi:hypothetical protein
MIDNYLPGGVLALLEDDDLRKSTTSWLAENIPVRAELWQVETALNRVVPPVSSRFFDIVCELQVARVKAHNAEIDRHRRKIKALQAVVMEMEGS